MTDFSLIKQAIDQNGQAFDAFTKSQGERLDALQDRLEELESKGTGIRTALTPVESATGARWLTNSKAERVLIADREIKLADHFRAGTEQQPFSVGEWARDAMLGREGKAASSTATVPTYIGAQIIDRVRAKTVLIQAGARTITIEAPTNLAKINGDPTVFEHSEAVADISESDVTATAVTLNPKLLAALIPLTVEVVADSPNLDDALQTSIANAFALKVDTLGIAAIIAASGLPVSASAHDPATWTGTNSAIAAALAANQDLPQAHISTPANYAARSVILASTAGSWLGKPPYLANMQELFTSSMTADQALFGDFSTGVAIVVRSDLRLELVRHGKPTSGQHLLVAHARIAPVVLQPARLFWQKKVP